MADRTTKVSLMAEVSGYMRGMEQAAKSTRDLDQAGQKAAETAQKQRELYDLLGRSLVAAGTMAIAATALAIKAAIDWETAWTGVEKVIDGTPAQIAAVEQELRNLTKILPASHDEIAAVAEAAGRLGIEAGSIAGFTKVMIDLGEATNITAEAAATDLARFMNVMGDSSDMVSNLGSAIVDLGNNFATSEAEIVAMSMRLSGAGRQVGLTSAQVLGLATSLSAVGIEAEAGGSAISKVMIEIASQVANGGDKLETFARTSGMSAEDFSNQWRTAPGEALGAFVRGLADAEMQGGSTLGILEELGITEVRMRDALLRSAAAADSFTSAMDRGSTAYEENNALAVEAEKRYATVAAQIDIARNAIVDAAIDFGQVFLPAVSAAAQMTGGFATALGELPDVAQGAIGVMTLVAGAVALSGGAFILAVPKIAAYRAAIATLGPAAQRASTAIGLLGKTAGVIAAIALAHELSKWEETLRGVRTSASELETSLLKIASGQKAVDDALLGGGWQLFRSETDLIKDNLQDLVSDSGEWLVSMNSALAPVERLFGLNDGLSAASSNVKELDSAMASLVEKGNVREAERAFEQLASYTDGSAGQLNRLHDLLPLYRAAQVPATDSTQSAAEAYLQAADEVSNLEGELRRLIDAVNAANGVGQNAVTSNAAYQQSIAEVDEYIRQAKEGVDGFTRSIDQSTPAGAANAAMFAGLAAEAQNAALGQFELDGNVNKYRESLERSRSAMLTQIEDLAETDEAAQDLIDTIFTIPTKREMTVIADTITAQNQLDAFMRTNANRMITIRSDYVSPVGMSARADGGLEEYANGGLREGIYAGRPGGILKFAEPETGWEAFISGKPGQEDRNRSIWMEAGARLGMSPANGTPAASVSTVVNQTFNMPPADEAVLAQRARSEMNNALRSSP